MDFGLQSLSEAMWGAYCSPMYFQQLHPYLNLEPVTLETLDRSIDADMDQRIIIPHDPHLRALDALVKLNWYKVQQTAVWKIVLVGTLTVTCRVVSMDI